MVVVVMEQGEIVAQGSYSDLSRNCRAFVKITQLAEIRRKESLDLMEEEKMAASLKRRPTLLPPFIRGPSPPISHQNHPQSGDQSTSEGQNKHLSRPKKESGI